MALPKAPELVVITSPSGARFSVAKAHQASFQGLINDLEAGGYPLNPKTSGGYNPRYIAGTTTPSRHAHAEAIDVNWDENARGKRGKIPTELARAVAAKHGMTWGGEWSNPDDMHFEVRQLKPGGALTKVAVPNAPPVTYAETGDPQFKSGLAVPQAPPEPVSVPDPASQAALASLALQQQQSGPFGGGGLGAPTSLGDAFAQVVKAGQPAPQPPQTLLGASQYQTNIGGPIPLSRRIG